MPDITIEHATIGGSRLAIVNNRTRDNDASTLFVSYTDKNQLVRTTFDYNIVATLGGFPLSISLYSDPDTDPSSSINQINNFYALNIIENTLADDLSPDGNTPTKPSDMTVTWNGNRLSASKIDGRYYLNVVNSGNTGNAANQVTLMGVPMAQGRQDELILNKTDYTIYDVEEYSTIRIGGSPLSVGRIGNSYYLLISPIVSNES